MSFAIKTTINPQDAADFIVAAMLKQFKQGKPVLLFLTGGSSILVGVEIGDLLRKILEENPAYDLTITLTDERYGPVNHLNSNYFQLLEKGFNLPEAKFIPILTGDDRNIATEKFQAALDQELKLNRENKYIIGLFGVGADGHTAGILPESEAVRSGGWALGYDTPIFPRITITPKVIEQLDEAVVWLQGKEKWSALEDLKKDIEIAKQPAQVLKKVPLLTIFTDFKII